VAWFAAKARYRGVRPGGGRRDLLEDSVFVFRSPSGAHARRRAEAIARAVERVDVDSQGRKIRWVLDRIVSVMEAGEIVDGAEVWRDRIVRPRSDGAA